MPRTITFTYSDGAGGSETYQIDEAVIDSLDKFRAIDTAPQQLRDGSMASLPKHATVLDFLIARLLDTALRPAVSLFPPTAIAALVEQEDAARAALEEAKTAVLRRPSARPRDS